MMKLKIFGVLAGAAVLAAGCVSTVSDTSTFTVTPAARDSVAGRYQRPYMDVYNASLVVVKRNGTLIKEYIPHDTTNNVRSLEARVSDRKVWIRVEELEPRLSQVDVQARGTGLGNRDLDVAHELEKEIALELASH